MAPPKPPKFSWPKPYLLSIYEKAVAEGCCSIQLPDTEQFASLKAAFYRLRRRADKQHAAFIQNGGNRRWLMRFFLLTREPDFLWL